MAVGEDTLEGGTEQTPRKGPRRGRTVEGVKPEAAGEAPEAGDAAAALQARDAGGAVEPGKADRALKPGKVDKPLKPGKTAKGVKPRKADRPAKPGRRVESEAAGERIESLRPDQSAPLDQPPSEESRETSIPRKAFAEGRLRRAMQAIAAVTALGMLVLSLLGLEASSDFFLASAVAMPVLVLAYFAGPGGAVAGRSMTAIFVLVAVGEGGALYALAADSSNPASVGLAVGGLAGIALLIAAAQWLRQRPTGPG